MIIGTIALQKKNAQKLGNLPKIYCKSITFSENVRNISRNIGTREDVQLQRTVWQQYAYS